MKMIYLKLSYFKKLCVHLEILKQLSPITYKSRRVVIPGGLGITKGFQYRVGGDNLIFQGLGKENEFVRNRTKNY